MKPLAAARRNSSRIIIAQNVCVQVKTFYNGHKSCEAHWRNRCRVYKNLGFGMIFITWQQIFQILRHRFSNNETIEAETLTGITTDQRKRNRQQRKRKKNKQEKGRKIESKLCELVRASVERYTKKYKRKQIEKKTKKWITVKTKQTNQSNNKKRQHKAPIERPKKL